MNHDPNDPSVNALSGEFRSLVPATEQRQPVDNSFFNLEKFLLAKIMRFFGNPPVAVELWDGQVISNHGENARARVHIRDRGALFKLVADPELNFGELYSAQRIEVMGGMLEFLEAVYRVWPFTGHSKFEMLLAPFYKAKRNTLNAARRNIQHHYDIGNDFYKLWLDERMLYTCAYFPHPEMTLEQAQLAKMDHVCRKLRLRPGETVVEAGCGWGALSMHMAKHYGVKVQAYNISREQVAYARERAHAEGLDGMVEFIEDDYRNVRGKFDAFVSVGMLEHVGPAHYGELGEVIDRSLKNNGRGLIHTIGVNYPRPMDAWLDRHIFPGACPPSLSQMMQIFEPYDFSVLDVENLRLHYSKTIEHWLRRYEDNVDKVLEMFDLEFVRAWRLYLAGSVATFKVGGMQLFQVVFARPDLNEIPWSRQYMYQQQPASSGGADGKL